MKNLNKIYIKGNTIYSKAPSSVPFNFINFFEFYSRKTQNERFLFCI